VKLLTWNSPFSIGLDFFFGFLPAMPLLFLCLLGTAITGQSFATFFLPANQQPRDSFSLIAFLMPLSGAFACSSLIVVTVWRAGTKAKWLFVLGLSIGVCIAAKLTFETLIVLLMQRTELGFLPLPMLAIPMAIVAIKHIFMLTRA
jgi:hypothetical protein